MDRKEFLGDIFSNAHLKRIPKRGMAIYSKGVIMKRISTLALIAFILSAIPFAAFAQAGPDDAAIRTLVQEAYVGGLLNLGDLEKTRAGFHSDFVLLGLRNNQLTRYPIAEWISATEKRKTAGQKVPPITCKFASIDITGYAAAVKLELFQNGKQIYTDYLSLYKFGESWKIVGKIYFAHS